MGFPVIRTKHGSRYPNKTFFCLVNENEDSHITGSDPFPKILKSWLLSVLGRFWVCFWTVFDHLFIQYRLVLVRSILWESLLTGLPVIRTKHTFVQITGTWDQIVRIEIVRRTNYVVITVIIITEFLKMHSMSVRTEVSWIVL